MVKEMEQKKRKLRLRDTEYSETAEDSVHRLCGGVTLVIVGYYCSGS